jgi:hypothetical protein
MSSRFAAVEATPQPRVVWGIEAIARVINRSPSQVRWLVQNRKLRVKRLGRRTFCGIEHELLEDVSGEIPAEAK